MARAAPSECGKLEHGAWSGRKKDDETPIQATAAAGYERGRARWGGLAGVGGSVGFVLVFHRVVVDGPSRPRRPERTVPEIRVA